MYVFLWNIEDLCFCLIFFFSSRRRHTRFDCDWSSTCALPISPLQLKMFWWGKHYQISPYAFGPGGSEPTAARESGGGSLAEFSLLGTDTTTVLGVNALHGSARTTQRTLVGPYLRLGMRSWGLLVEHDITNRSLTASTSFLQHATYAQLFWYPREWLLISTIGEQLQIQRPFQE